MIKLYRAETISAVLTTCVAALAIGLAVSRNIRIELASFAMPLFVAAAMLLAAGYYRVSGRSPNIALAMASCAIFILFSNSGAALNYALLPTNGPLIDDLLFQADAAIGFHWSDFARALASYPFLSEVLSWVYRSSLIQLAIVILLLGFTGRQVALHRFLIVGTFASCLSILTWALAPSFGPSPYIMLDPSIDASLGRVVDLSYGSHLLELAEQGPSIIAGGKMLGLIAFPSMHTVMACMSVWFTRRTRAFWPSAALNLAMIPAILVHGGHHLVDIFAGCGVFALVLWAACRLIPAQETSVGQQRTDHTVGRPFPTCPRPALSPRTHVNSQPAA